MLITDSEIAPDWQRIEYANELEVLGDRMSDDIGDVANQIDVMSFDVDIDED